MQSHPSWVCGLKHDSEVQGVHPIEVTPFVGVWIETREMLCRDSIIKSHPSWVCGLKLRMEFCLLMVLLSHPSWVCGLKQVNPITSTADTLSHPSWVCGLKPLKSASVSTSGRHTLRGCVD
mgnify:CR=1 FL=1